MGIATGATAGESGSQNNMISNVNTEGEHFLHFGIIGTNLFERFKAFEGNNNNSSSGNNNNNNLPLPFLPSGFGGGLEGGFNPPSEGNARRLDPNVVALVNALTETNLRINHVERESNHIKLAEFGGQKQKILMNN